MNWYARVIYWLCCMNIFFFSSSIVKNVTQHIPSAFYCKPQEIAVGVINRLMTWASLMFEKGNCFSANAHATLP